MNHALWLASCREAATTSQLVAALSSGGQQFKCASLKAVTGRIFLWV